MLLRHSLLGAIDHFVDELFTIWQRLFASIDIAGFFVVGDEQVIAPVAPAGVDVFAKFHEALGAQNGQSTVAPAFER